MPIHRTERQLSEILERPKRALLDPQYWRAPLCRRLLYHVDVVALFTSAQARPLAILGVRLALRIVRRQYRRGIKSRCILALAYAVLGSTYRAMGILDKAARYLDKAGDIARRCLDPDIRSDVLVRRAVLQAYLAQRPDGTLNPSGLQTAFRLAQSAVADARGPLANARAQNTRGMILLYSGDAERAAQDAKAALATLDYRESPYDHIAALTLLINSLLSGDKADRDEACQHLEQLRGALPRRCPAIRGRFLWAEGLLLFHNRRRKSRARNRLDQARRKFIRRGMRAEAAAVTADLARHDPAGSVPRLCADLLPILDPGPIRDLVEQLRVARLVDRVDLAEALRSMIAGPAVLPSAP